MRIFADRLPIHIIGCRGKAKAHDPVIDLVGGEEIVRQTSCLAQSQRKNPGGKGIERAGVADLL